MEAVRSILLLSSRATGSHLAAACGRSFSVAASGWRRRLCHSAGHHRQPDPPPTRPEEEEGEGRRGVDEGVRAGQPLPHTHPHLLQPGQVTFGITREEYSERRHRLMERLGEREGHHHVVLLPGTPKRYMVDKIPYLYRQDTDMLYLSGCLEPGCLLLLHSLPGRPAPMHRSVMFTPRHEAPQELWDGPRTRPDHAPAVWGVDAGLPLEELTRYLDKLERDLGSPALWYQPETTAGPGLHRQLQAWLATGGRLGAVESPRPHVHALRVVKSPAEQQLMRQACRISAEAIAATMRSTRTPASEHQLFATVDYHARMRGADHLAYPPVVAGGPRANTIHYTANNTLVQPGQMVLMDAGAEFRGYSGDVTRTWPVDGEFSPAQRDLYEAVAEVQEAVVQACASQRPTLDQLFALMCASLGRVLQELCILPLSYSGHQLSRAAYLYCPHHVSHYLGMDVHDTAHIPRSRPLTPGTVITVEPGIYIREDNRTAPTRYLGLGVRLEDDVLVTESGVEVLTAACPKHPDEVEAIVGADYK
ncbi:LOW QUALITY PROTEIN: xaa-Pro aminopeptidase 3-like [Scylla paramamosain]